MNRWCGFRPLGRSLAFGLAALAAASCGANGAGIGDDCSLGACDTQDAGADISQRDASSEVPAAPSSDAIASADAGPVGSRSPLCAVTGCFPGFPGACSPLLSEGGFAAAPEASGFDPQAADDDAELPDAEDAGDAASDAAVGADAIGLANDGSTSAAEDAALIVIDQSLGMDASASNDAPRIEAGAGDGAYISQSCYVVPASIGVITACAPVGSGASGSTCGDSKDCGSLLACVEVDGAGVCQPFSCALPPSCPAGTFYQLSPLLVGGAPVASATVPVCSPTVSCALLAGPSSCPTGKVCAVVGNQGETSCMVPGAAKQNDWCDEGTRCAEGLVCSLRPNKDDNRCLKLCHVGAGAVECPGGTCQGGNKSIPDGFGICVGDNPDAG